MAYTVLTVLAVLGAGVCLYFMETKIKRGLTAIDKDFRIPDMRLHYGAEELYSCLDSIGEDGRALIRRYWLIDYGFIVCFWFIMVSVGRSNVHIPTLQAVMLVAASVRAALDMLENTLLICVTRAYPARRHDRLASVCGYVTSVKFVALGVWIACLFGALFVSALRMGR